MILLTLSFVVGLGSGGYASDQLASSARAKRDTNGVLRLAAIFSANAIRLDPAKNGNNSYVGPLALMFGTPIRKGPKNGEYQPWLASSWKVVDPTTFELNLRPNLTFQDGEPYNAENFKRGILRTRDIKTPNLNQGFLASISDIVVEGATKLTFKFSAPNAGQAVDILTRFEGMIPSPKTVDYDRAPIGAGPYKLERFVVDNSLKLARWDGFYDRKSYLLAGVEYINAVGGQPTLNALQADQVDLIIVDAPAAAALDAQPAYGTVSLETGSYFYLGMCLNGSVLGDVRVRRALQLAVDRKEINEAVQAGLGTVQVGLWPKGSPYAVPSIEKNTKPNQKKARELLAEAGVSNLSFDVGVQAGIPAQIKVGEVLQGQLAEIGVKVNVVQSPSITGDWLPNRRGLAWTTNITEKGVSKLERQFAQATSLYNLCQFQDPRINRLTTQIAGLSPEDPAAKQPWAEVQKIAYDDVLNIPLATTATVFGFNNRVKGLKALDVGVVSTQVPNIEIRGVYIARS